jgi:hypothetical protein
MRQYICSVYYDELSESRPYRVPGSKGFRHEYKIPAADKEGYQVLAVDDAEQLVYVGDGRYLPTPVYADARDGMPGIAQDIADIFRSTGIAIEAGGPGVGVIAGPEPTSAELAALRQRQLLWCKAACNKAESDWREQKRHLVGPVQRAMARWLGEMQYEWVWRQEAAQVILKPCPLCMTQIDSNCVVCPQCNRVIDAEELERRMAARQPVTPKPAPAPEPKPEKPAPLPPPLTVQKNHVRT